MTNITSKPDQPQPSTGGSEQSSSGRGVAWSIVAPVLLAIAAFAAATALDFVPGQAASGGAFALWLRARQVGLWGPIRPVGPNLYMTLGGCRGFRWELRPTLLGPRELDELAQHQLEDRMRLASRVVDESADVSARVWLVQPRWPRQLPDVAVRLENEIPAEQAREIAGELHGELAAELDALFFQRPR